MYIRFFKGFMISLLMMVIFISNCGDKSTQPVARVGGRIITVGQFENMFSRGKAPDALAKATLQDKKDFLNNMINNELQLVSAYQKGLDKDKEVMENVEKRGENVIIRRLIDLEVIDKIIPEADIKKNYDKAKKQVQIEEIAIKMTPNPTDQEKENVDKKLQTIKQELKNGTDFSELVKKYSEDAQQAANQKRTLKWAPSIAEDPVFQNAFTMRKGQISEQLKTNRGYSFIKVIDIMDANLRPYSMERERIQQDFMRMKSSDLEKRYFAYLDQLKIKYHAKSFDENIQKIVDISKKDSSEQGSSPIPKDIDAILSKFSDDERKSSLVEYDGGAITIEKFLEELKMYPIPRRPDIAKKEEIITLLDKRFIPQALLTKEAKDRNIAGDKQVKEKLKEFSESFMLTKIKKLEVDDKIAVPEDSVKKYYEKNLEEFKNPEMREVQEIFVTNESLANQIFSRAKAGENFTKLARKYNEKTSTKKNDGNLGFIRDSRQYIGKPAFETKLNSIAGPIKAGNSYSIIKVLSIQEATYKTYEEAKRFVSVKVEREMKNGREQQWIDEMRKEIKVTVYEDRVDNTFSKFRKEE